MPSCLQQLYKISRLVGLIQGGRSYVVSPDVLFRALSNQARRPNFLDPALGVKGGRWHLIEARRCGGHRNAANPSHDGNLRIAPPCNVHCECASPQVPSSSMCSFLCFCRQHPGWDTSFASAPHKAYSAMGCPVHSFFVILRTFLFNMLWSRWPEGKLLVSNMFCSLAIYHVPVWSRGAAYPYRYVEHSFPCLAFWGYNINRTWASSRSRGYSSLYGLCDSLLTSWCGSG